MKAFETVFSLAAILSNAAMAAEFNIRTIPSGLSAEIGKSPAMLNAIGNARRTRGINLPESDFTSASLQ